jgi:MFS family permease
VLWYSVEKLFMVAIGFSAWTITITTVTYVLVMAAVNIPAGILADRWSRKGVLYLASGALAAASLICGLAHGIWGYAAGIIVWGGFFACYQGTYGAAVYDTLLEEAARQRADIGAAAASLGDDPSPAGYDAAFGKIAQYDAAAYILGALASAVLLRAGMSLRAEFLASVPLSCCSFVTLRRWREPELHRAREKSRVREHVAMLWQAMTRNRRVVWITFAYAANLLAARLVYEFCQLWWISAGLAAALFGPAFAALYGGTWLGGQIPGWLRSRRPAILACGLPLVAASAGLFARSAAAAIGAQVAAVAGIIAVQIALSGMLHDEMPSHLRAGAESGPGTISMVLFVPTALAFGAVTRSAGVTTASWLVALPLAAMVIAVGVVALTTGMNPDDWTALQEPPGRPERNIR